MAKHSTVMAKKSQVSVSPVVFLLPLEDCLLYLKGFEIMEFLKCSHSPLGQLLYQTPATMQVYALKCIHMFFFVLLCKHTLCESQCLLVHLHSLAGDIVTKAKFQTGLVLV